MERIKAHHIIIVLIVGFVVYNNYSEDHTLSGTYCAKVFLENDSIDKVYDGKIDVIEDRIIFIYYNGIEKDVRKYDLMLEHYDDTYDSQAQFNIGNDEYLVSIDWGRADECSE